MSKNSLSDQTVKLLKRTSVTLGIIIILGSALANFSGLSAANKFSFNQIGFLLAGAILVFIGVLGRKFAGVYKSTGVILLNILVAFFILEMASIAVVKVIDNERFSVRERKILEGHLEEVDRMTMHGLYAPFVVWRSNPILNSDSVTVNSTGYRTTTRNPEETTITPVVMVFGGSSIWGTGVSDNETVPSHLQHIFNESSSQPVIVLNKGQTAYSSTQEVIELMLQLRDGNVPDMVIYCDGFNDIWGAYESGQPGSHHGEKTIAAKLNGTSIEPALKTLSISLLEQTNSWLLVTSLRSKLVTEEEEINLETYRTMGISPDSLANAVVELYIENTRLIMALAAEYDFKVLFVLQPTLWYCNKETTEYEKGVLLGDNPFFLAGGDPDFSELLVKSYNIFSIEAESQNNFVSYTSIFDDVEETVYTDYSGVHVYGWANRMIADNLASDIRRIAPELFE